jgi:hypothetical protein
MQLVPRLALAAAVVILTATAACGGDSTGPGDGGGTTPSLARHFDSLYVTAKAQSASDTNYKFRAVALSDLELPAAFGATATNITVTTASGTETWKGFVFEEVRTSGGTPTDSGRLVLAYRDGDAHTLVVTVILKDGSLAGASLMTQDTVVLQASAKSGAVTLTSTGDACPAPPSGLTNPVISTANQATCLLATLGAAFDFDFPAKTGVDAALTHISFALTSFDGVRLQDPVVNVTTGRVTRSLFGGDAKEHR